MTVLYQAYGNQEIINQVLTSAVSLLKWNVSNLKIVIYTDFEETLKLFFRSEPAVSITTITKEQLQQWRGKVDFLHRAKLEMMRHCGERHRGAIVYCDGDTLFEDDPKPLLDLITDEQSLMHVNEGRLEEEKNVLAKKLNRFLKQKKFVTSFGEVEITGKTEMWNAGVIGLSEKNKYIVSKAIELTDQLYSKYQKHTMEQLAVSYLLQSQSALMPADRVVFHYWNQKTEFSQILEKFIQDNPTSEQAVSAYRRKLFPIEKPNLSKKNGLMQKLKERIKLKER